MYIRENDTVVNTVTMLVWQDDTSVTSNSRTWSSAIDYCESLTLASKSDWRLPNINELNTIVDDTKYNPAINSMFQNTVNSLYWSSTTYARTDWKDRAWAINFSSSSTNYGNKTSTYYIRCVRNLK